MSQVYSILIVLDGIVDRVVVVVGLTVVIVVGLTVVVVVVVVSSFGIPGGAASSIGKPGGPATVIPVMHAHITCKIIMKEKVIKS